MIATNIKDLSEISFKRKNLPPRYRFHGLFGVVGADGTTGLVRRHLGSSDYHTWQSVVADWRIAEFNISAR
jgi:hypothetical protein